MSKEFAKLGIAVVLGVVYVVVVLQYVLNKPDQIILPENPRPVVNVEAPIINVESPIINVPADKNLHVQVENTWRDPHKAFNDFESVQKWAADGRLFCNGTGPVIAVEANGGSLNIAVGASGTDNYAVVIFRSDDIWPRAVAVGIPLIICEDGNGRVQWVGHAGFEGQGRVLETPPKVQP